MTTFQNPFDALGRIVSNPPENKQHGKPNYHQTAIGGHDYSHEEAVRDADINAAALAEAALLRDLNTCQQLTFCLVGAATQTGQPEARIVNQLTMADGVRSAVDSFRKVGIVVINRKYD